ncbi:hypothetical protein ABVK25_008555 [Lepraria finkii]|uniref:Uncharacterized protein n=1 Tax=Lepraria finkii TaxID=1340010 RepID=A0ABR4B2C0_9LECA
MAAGFAGSKILDEETTDRLNDLGERMKQMVQDVIDKHVYSEVPHTNGHDSTQLFNDEENTTQPQHSDTVPKMWISGIGSILAIHFACSSMQSTLQSLYYHHTLTEGISLAECRFMALNIEMDLEHVQALVAATGRFVEKYRDLIHGA